MKTETAIEILEPLIERPILWIDQAHNDALRLSIEALKYYQETRPAEVSSFCPLLPGETEED